MNDSPLRTALRELCLFLDAIEMDYMLVGGLAVGIWGEPRATVDIDFLVAVGLDDFNILKQKVTESNKFVFIHDKPMVFERITFLRATLKSNTDIAVDLLLADDEFKNTALRRKELIHVNDFSLYISSPEDLIILKVLSGRVQDRLDAEKILAIQQDSLHQEYIRNWTERLGIVLKKERQ